jgi:hypothetical protein
MEVLFLLHNNPNNNTSPALIVNPTTTSDNEVQLHDSAENYQRIVQNILIVATAQPAVRSIGKYDKLAVFKAQTSTPHSIT